MTEESRPNQTQAEIWNGPGGQTWAELSAMLDEVLGPLNAPLLDAADGGTRVLDVGCGAGGTTLGIARRLRPRGQCTGIDIAAPLIEAATRRAAAEAATDVTFIRGDAQTYNFAAGAFDTVLSRFGVMFFDDPEAAFANLRRALRPGGRLAFVAWRSRSENPFMTAAERATAEPEEEDGNRPLSDRLMTELTAHHTLALREAVANDPDVALRAALHALCLKLFYHYGFDTCLEIEAKSVLFGHTSGLADTLAAKAIGRERGAAASADHLAVPAMFLMAFQSFACAEGVNLGTRERVAVLFSHPANCHSVCFLPQTLEEVVEKYLRSSLDRDGFTETKLKVVQEDGSVVVHLEGDGTSVYADRLPKFLAAGDKGHDGATQLLKQKRWRYNWRFFLPLGLPIANHRSIQLLHFPPDYVLEEVQDYLLATRRSGGPSFWSSTGRALRQPTAIRPSSTSLQFQPRRAMARGFTASTTRSAHS